MVGLIDAFLHSRDEARLVFEHATHRLSHQLLSILAIRRSHLLEPHFDIRREMYFHIPKRRDGNVTCQGYRVRPPSALTLLRARYCASRSPIFQTERWLVRVQKPTVDHHIAHKPASAQQPPSQRADPGRGDMLRHP